MDDMKVFTVWLSKPNIAKIKELSQGITVNNLISEMIKNYELIPSIEERLKRLEQ